MKSISLLIKPVGSACNMNCKYCFYRDEQNYRSSSPAVMDESTLYNVFSKTLPYAAGRCVVAFQGGEPTLAGLNFFKKAIEIENKFIDKDRFYIENSLQTNGLLIDDVWAEFLANNKFLVGISLDGNKELHDKNRVDNNGLGTYDRVIKSISTLKKHNVDFNILSVITHNSCKNPTALYGYFLSNSMLWQQYIPCLDPLEEAVGNNPWSLQKGDLKKFLCEQFDCWYRGIINSRPTYNRYFNNLISLILCGNVEACDMRGMCGKQLVVEANGNVYPCDFYCIDKYLLGNFNTDSLSDIEKARDDSGFVKESVYRDIECSSCKWFKLCRGGCKRHRSPYISNESFADRNRFCDDFYAFFEHSYERLCEIAEKFGK